MEKTYDFAAIRNEFLEPEKLIKASEAAFHAELHKVADRIINSDGRRDVILISGPSSSGKSTSANLIRSYIAAAGIDSVAMSTDDFFFNKDEMRMDEAGFDFESPTIVNELLLLDKVNELLLKGEAHLPRFDFVSGKKVYQRKKEHLSSRGVIIIEGIHALNKDVIEMGSEIDTVRAYVSVSSSLRIGEKTVSGRTLRLARRIVRDSKFRGASMDTTMNMWDSVCEGEDKYIRPYKSTADFIIDTMMPYEPFMLRNSMLSLIGQCDGRYDGNKRIEDLKYLYSECVDGDLSMIPSDSLLREFVGGGIYG